jgi:hypothetical protein
MPNNSILPRASSPGSALTVLAALPDCTVVADGDRLAVYTDRGVTFLLAQRAAERMGCRAVRFKASPAEAAKHGGHIKLVVALVTAGAGQIAEAA